MSHIRQLITFKNARQKFSGLSPHKTKGPKTVYTISTNIFRRKGSIKTDLKARIRVSYINSQFQNLANFGPQTTEILAPFTHSASSIALRRHFTTKQTAECRQTEMPFETTNSTVFQNLVNFGSLTAEISWLVSTELQLCRRGIAMSICLSVRKTRAL